MREILISQTEPGLTKFDPISDPKFPAENIKNVLCRVNSSEKLFSVELCSNRNIELTFLSAINPLFYSITWHNQFTISGNNVKNLPAISLASALSTRSKNVLLHLGCRYLSKDLVFGILNTAKEHGIMNIFALQGETAKSENFTNTSNDFLHAIDLVKYIKEHFYNTFCVGVAGYPEGHPKSTSLSADLSHLKEKVDAGADFIITQTIFDSQTFHNFYKKCRNIGIVVPIVPGIYIINTYNEMLAMARICHVKIPENILSDINLVKDDNVAVQQFGVRYAVDLIKTLLSNHEFPVSNVHIFSLNNIDSLLLVCKEIDFCNVTEKPL